MDKSTDRLTREMSTTFFFFFFMGLLFSCLDFLVILSSHTTLSHSHTNISNPLHFIQLTSAYSHSTRSSSRTQSHSITHAHTQVNPSLSTRTNEQLIDNESPGQLYNLRPRTEGRLRGHPPSRQPPKRKQLGSLWIRQGYQRSQGPRSRQRWARRTRG